MLTSIICRPVELVVMNAVLLSADSLTARTVFGALKVPIMLGIVAIPSEPLLAISRSQALKVNTSLIVPLKFSSGAKESLVLLSACNTRAELSETVPTSSQVRPLSVEK